MAIFSLKNSIVIGGKFSYNRIKAGDEFTISGSAYFISATIAMRTGLVNRVYDEVVKIKGADSDASAVFDEKPVYGNRLQRAIRMFSDVFVPIIPVLVATGLFMGLRGMLTQTAVLAIFGMTPDDVHENLLTYTRVLTDTAFAFSLSLISRGNIYLLRRKMVAFNGNFGKLHVKNRVPLIIDQSLPIGAVYSMQP